MNNSKILYFLIGDPDNLIPLGSYPSKIDKEISNDALSIFRRYCKADSKEFDNRGEIKDGQRTYYFTLHSSNIFFLVYGTNLLSKRDAFLLIESVSKENISMYIDKKTGMLNSEGKNKLKSIIENYDEPNKIEKINIELQETKNVMQKDIEQMAKNVQEVEILEQKSNSLKQEANTFNQESKKLNCVAWWQNCKWCIILALVIVLLIVIFVPVGITIGKKDKNDDDKK